MSLAFTEKRSDITIIRSESISVSQVDKALERFLRREGTRAALNGNERAIYEKLKLGVKRTQYGTETNK